MGEILAIGNIKGGVGKTTLTAQLAGIMHDQGQKVLAIDADPHATLTSWACGGPLAQIVRHEPLRSVKQIGDWVQFMRDARERHDMVLLDLPSGPNSAITTGLMVATRLLMPVGPGEADIHGSDQTLKLLHLAHNSRNGVPSLWVIPNRFDSRARMTPAMTEWLASVGAMVSDPIAQRSAIAETATHGRWLGKSKSEIKARTELEAVLDQLPETQDGAIRSVA